jgi:hypothetical protein
MGFNELMILVNIAIIATIFFAIRDLLRNQFINTPIKVYYLLVIIFIPILGVIIYYTSASKYKVH